MGTSRRNYLSVMFSRRLVNAILRPRPAQFLDSEVCITCQGDLRRKPMEKTNKDARMAKISLACSSPKRKQQSVVLEGIPGHTHSRALGTLRPTTTSAHGSASLLRFHNPLCSNEHVDHLITTVDSSRCWHNISVAPITPEPGIRSGILALKINASTRLKNRAAPTCH